MAHAASISLQKFIASVQSAVAEAVKKHPKLKVDPPHAVSLDYLVRGFPVPPELLNAVPMGEIQAFAVDVAAHIGGAHPGLAAARGPAPEGAVYSAGKHIIIGIPPALEASLFEK